MKTIHLNNGNFETAKKLERRELKLRKCNLCKDEFRRHTPFDRFCAHCKKENEVFKFGTCFPEIEDVVSQCGATA